MLIRSPEEMMSSEAVGRDAVIFDLDGTLLDTLDDLAAGVNYCMEKYGVPLHTREEVRGMVGNGIYVLLEKALPGGRDFPQYDECVQDFSRYYSEHMMDRTRAFDGIDQMLERLAERGYGLAIVSNKFDSAVKDLNRQYFGDVIPVAIGEAEAAGIKKKPAPDTVFAAMRELGAEPRQCICVGDSEVDIRTARNAGMPCICVTWGFKTREFLEDQGAEFIVDTPEELLEEILSFED